MITRVLSYCLLFGLLSACVANPYKIADDQRENASTLKGYAELHTDGRDRVRVWLHSIDGKRVSQPAWGAFDPQALDAQALIAPGDREVGVSLKVNVTLHANCPCRETIVLLNAKIAPNSQYGAIAERGHGFVDLWIENLKTREPVSAKLRFRPEPG